MKIYNSFKISGIEWIGEIPSHWKKTRLAFNGKFYKGKGVSKADLSIDGLPVILYGDIYTKYNQKTEQLVRRIPFEVAQYSFPIKREDLLFAASGETPDEIGKCICYLGEGDAYASGDVIVFRQNSSDSVFLSYLFNSYKVNEQKAKLSKGEIVVHIYSGQLRDIHFPLPPKPEQTAIANYLDRKTAEIDELIADKKRLLELYEEEKTAIINDLVKGKKVWNGDAWTEPAEVKDSGIEWLGDASTGSARGIPEHWEVIKGKYMYKILSGFSPISFESGEEKIQYFKVDDLNYLHGEFLLKGLGNKVEELKSYYPFPKGTILFPKRGAAINLNKIAITEEPCYFDTNLMGLEITSSEIEPVFLCFFISNRGLIDIADTSTIPQINNKHIAPMEIILPPIKEQQIII